MVKTFRKLKFFTKYREEAVVSKPPDKQEVEVAPTKFHIAIHDSTAVRLTPPPPTAASPDPQLDEILQDLVIDHVEVPQVTPKGDEVSDFSGGSPKSVDDESTECTDETDEKGDEDSTEDILDKRVNKVVLNVTEEIRKTAGSPAVKVKKSIHFKQREHRDDDDEILSAGSTVDQFSESMDEEDRDIFHRRGRNQREEVEDESHDDRSESPARHNNHVSDSMSIESCTTHSSGDDFARHQYSRDQTETSEFLRNPQAESVNRTNEKCLHKDIMIHGPGGASALMVRAMYYVPLPREDCDVVMKVEASTVSFRDCLLRRGLGAHKAPFPLIPGCQAVGTISALGNTALTQGYRVGDRVMAMHRRGGGNAKYARYHFSCLAPLKAEIDAAEAVCLGEVYMTAFQALRMGRKNGAPLTGSNVLVTDGYSPVGQAAIELAKFEGANVFVTITESRQESYMKTLGVKCLPFAPSKWLPKIKGRMDIVIDNTCFDSYDSSWKALNSKGILICTGMTSIYGLNDFGMGGEFGCGAFGDTRDIEAKWATMKAKYIMSQTKFYDLWDQYVADPSMYLQELKYLCFLVEEGRINPKIAQKVTIEEVPDAQRYLESGKANGTIVCLP